MDPVSQGLLGSCLAGFLVKKTFKKSSFCGFIGGVAPDLDIFIRSSLTHYYQLIIIDIFLIHYFFADWWLYCIYIFISNFRKNYHLNKHIYFLHRYFSHGLLDACCSYGTVLFWPFSDLRIGLNIISIIDPIFTGILFVCF